MHTAAARYGPPLAEFDDEARNALIERAGFEVLPYRSEECHPCIFSARADLRRVAKERVDQIRAIETDLGVTMFRPKAYMGAKGIDEVMKWARSERGQYRSPELEREVEEEADCDSGFCGA